MERKGGNGRLREVKREKRKEKERHKRGKGRGRKDVGGKRRGKYERLWWGMETERGMERKAKQVGIEGSKVGKAVNGLHERERKGRKDGTRGREVGTKGEKDREGPLNSRIHSLH